MLFTCAALVVVCSHLLSGRPFQLSVVSDAILGTKQLHEAALPAF
jgi:hypothetical protein